MFEEKVKKALETIRLSLQSHGGDVEFVSASPDGVVSCRLTGRCGMCPSAQATLKNIVESGLKEEIPEVTAVVGV